MSKTASSVWEECLSFIQDNIKPQAFKTWFEPIKPVKLSGEALTIQVPSKFFYEWLEEHYVGLLRKTIKRELGNDARLEYRIVVDNSSNGNAKPFTVNYPNYNTGNNKNPEVAAPLVMGNSIKNPFIIPGLKKVNIESQLSPAYNFDNFVEGDCNRLARSAGFAVGYDSPSHFSREYRRLFGAPPAAWRRALRATRREGG